MSVLDPSLSSLAINLALAGTLVSLAVLGLEYFTPGVANRRITAFGGLLLAAVAAGLLASGITTEFCLPAVAIGGAMLIPTIVGHRVTRRCVDYFLRPVCWWTLVLAASISVAVYVTFAAKARFADDEFTLSAVPTFRTIDTMVAITDQGRELSVNAYDDASSLLDSERGVLGLTQFQHQVIRLADPTVESNCHGWVYCGGKYAILSRDVDAILADNAYEQVVQPGAGDLVIYRSSQGEVTHTGLVRMVTDDGTVFVESKWGPLGVYLHPVDAQPYGDSGQRAFYRSPRLGHQLAVFSKPVPAKEQPALASPSSVDGADAVLTAVRGRPSARRLNDRANSKLRARRRI